MAAQIHNHIKLVAKTKEREAVERVVDQFRMIYENWDREDIRSLYHRSRKDSDTYRKDVWMMCVGRHDSDTILATMDSVLSGETEFNVTPPTPMQFSELCSRAKINQNERVGLSEDILAWF